MLGWGVVGGDGVLGCRGGVGVVLGWLSGWAGERLYRLTHAFTLALTLTPALALALALRSMVKSSCVWARSSPASTRKAVRGRWREGTCASASRKARRGHGPSSRSLGMREP